MVKIPQVLPNSSIEQLEQILLNMIFSFNEAYFCPSAFKLFISIY